MAGASSWRPASISSRVAPSPDEAKDIPEILELNETRLKSISFLTLVEHNYVQAPYQEISKEVYEQAKAKLGPLNFEMVNTDEAQDLYCDGDKCMVDLQPRLPEQQEVPFPEEQPEESPAAQGDEVGAPAN